MEQLMEQGAVFFVIVLEWGFIFASAIAGYKAAALLWPHIKPLLKKHEPAIRQRVHDLAKAIYW